MLFDAPQAKSRMKSFGARYPVRSLRNPWIVVESNEQKKPP